ncbi:MAG: pyrroline-5-carboxylate reductase [Pseudobdellovibrio sp.]|uniref:pyrroline-5-carboxylate reductase family protein n=1 Tax=Pseudobdellovibrio sp. HCB154 TaxID=3386277 RepID=UPI003916F780|nr:pyrroline-5-carboxylate reductase [Pseudobdellovibrio sp.]
MTHPLLKTYKVGFIGAGHMAQALIKGMVESKLLRPDQILVSNRTPGKPLKLKELYQIQTREHNEQIVEECDIVILAMKPQDLPQAMANLASAFNENQIVISLAAGITMRSLQKMIPQPRLVRLMPNTPSLIGRGVLGVLANKKDEVVTEITKDLFSGLGVILELETEDQFDALMISCSSGTGFVFEMMMYWQDWIIEHGFTPEQAKMMTIETFVGASLLAAQSAGVDIEELQQRVTSKKGVTAAGLNSMRELEIERALRISFEKAALRSQEIARQT